MKKEVIRPGDVVKIINPEFFLRCGYPLSLNDGMKMVMEDEKDKEDFLKFCYRFGVRDNSKDYYAILKIIGYHKLCSKEFGGRDRKIYTKRLEDAKDHEFAVVGKKMVVTGTYTPACKTGWEYVEWEPPCLMDAKSHMILCIEDGSVDGDFFYIHNLFNKEVNGQWVLSTDDSIWPLSIERCNIELVRKKEIVISSDFMLVNSRGNSELHQA